MLTVGGAAAGMTLGVEGGALSALAAEVGAPAKKPAVMRGAFLYPPTELLEKAGYYSWPGAGYDAEGHHKEYLKRITASAEKLKMQVRMEEGPLYEKDRVGRFIQEVRETKPDGLLLVLFKKSEWESIKRIVKETGVPTVAMATLGVLLNPHVNQLYRAPGVYVISSLDDFEAIENGMRMVRTASWMRQARILSVTGEKTSETTVNKLGTKVRVVPMKRYADVYKDTPTSDRVRQIARAYTTGAKKCVEPSEADVLEAARLYVSSQRIMVEEQSDAIMIQCLQGIQKRWFPPPCMAYMSLRDEGVVAGCQNDLDATLTMMLVQRLFDRAGFQQNAACNTEKNHYFGAHCTCPSKLHGPSGPAAPFILRDHAEAGVGTVPQVLWPAGERVTMAHYLSREKPEMIVYSGEVVRCIDTPPAGGCRTNIEIAFDGVDDACAMKGMHQTVFCGDHERQLRRFCQLYDIPVVT